MLDILEAIHEAAFPTMTWNRSKVKQLLVDYYLDNPSHVPEWMTIFLRHILHRTPHEMRFDAVGSDIGSLFLELKNHFGWMIDDYGEGITFSFPRLGVTAFISREAKRSDGTHCCSFQVRLAIVNHH